MQNVNNKIIQEAMKDRSTKQFKIYADNTKAYLAVKTEDIKRYGLQVKLSSASRIKGQTVYLDTDRDADLFLDEYSKHKKYRVTVICQGNRSIIRNFPVYSWSDLLKNEK